MPVVSRIAALALALSALACGHAHTKDAAAGGQDSTFAAMQARGAEAMGVDQYTSSHVFESLPDGGRITLERDVPDSAGVAAIRAHMRTIAERFAAGDFAIPGFVHDTTVPGTAVMAARRDRITYVADTLPRGGQLRITTTDPEALAAVHAFLAFQRSAHHAAGGGHQHDSMAGH
jgi:hypothetical protein